MPQKTRCKRLHSSLFVNPRMVVLTAVCQGLSERVHGHTRTLRNNPRYWTDTLARPTSPRPALPGKISAPPDLFCPGLIRGLGWHARESRASMDVDNNQYRKFTYH